MGRPVRGPVDVAGETEEVTACRRPDVPGGIRRAEGLESLFLDSGFSRAP